ncbi:MAG: tRNA pseudouridine(38-40) synthase TruA [Pseudanabaenaceae cyanobacterium bins.68]|nr:tRNA pseudouridine(38-40) synthase TruA [Pseudanabaenaceae cyanobacterium bins.68]
MPRIALLIQYLGGQFHGWQRQLGQISVQQVIEEAIAEVVGSVLVIHGAGRTDTGVHAAAQVAHFDYDGVLPASSWVKVLNARLPPDVRILAASLVSSSWHARFSAIARKYRYTIYTHPLPNLFVRDFSWHFYHEVLQVNLMAEALQPMVGEQNLSAVQKAGSKRSHARVEVKEVKCWQQQEFVYVEVEASGFLYGMMRLLVGTLVEVGRGRLSVAEFTDIWQQQRRDLVRYAAPPQGLCLLAIKYPLNPFPLVSL